MTSFELIGTMRDRLENIRQWRGQLTDVMLAITSHGPDLTGIRGTTDRIPGGDALAMLGPWAPDADHGDDLPHPDQVLREWRETITEETHTGSWAECWRWHWDQAQRILESPWAEEWQQDLTALWWRLAKLTGNEPEREPEPEITSEMVVDALRQNPEHRLTRRDLSTIFEIPASTITTWRSRGLEADERGKYRAGDILERLAG